MLNCLFSIVKMKGFCRPIFGVPGNAEGKLPPGFGFSIQPKLARYMTPFKNSHSCHGAFPKSLRLKVVFHALSIQINYPAFCPWLIGTKGLCKGRCKNASVPCWSQHKQHFTFKLFILHIKLGILAPFTRLFEVRKMASTGRLSCWDQNPSK